MFNLPDKTQLEFFFTWQSVVQSGIAHGREAFIQVKGPSIGSDYLR